jgi:hypothetical protein
MLTILALTHVHGLPLSGHEKPSARIPCKRGTPVASVSPRTSGARSSTWSSIQGSKRSDHHSTRHGVDHRFSFRSSSRQ